MKIKLTILAVIAMVASASLPAQDATNAVPTLHVERFILTPVQEQNILVLDIAFHHGFQNRFTLEKKQAILQAAGVTNIPLASIRRVTLLTNANEMTLKVLWRQ